MKRRPEKAAAFTFRGTPMKTSSAIVTAALMVLSSAAFAASPEPPGGAASCSPCHATNATIQTPMPNIYGRKPDEIVAAFKAFRSGQRPSTVMGRIAKGYTDDEVQQIADWLATQKQGGSR